MAIYNVYYGWVNEITYVSLSDYDTLKSNTGTLWTLAEDLGYDDMPADSSVSDFIYYALPLGLLTDSYIFKVTDEWIEDNGDPTESLDSFILGAKRHFASDFIPWLYDKVAELKIKLSVLDKTATELLADVTRTIAETNSTTGETSNETSASGTTSNTLTQTGTINRDETGTTTTGGSDMPETATFDDAPTSDVLSRLEQYERDLNALDTYNRTDADSGTSSESSTATGSSSTSGSVSRTESDPYGTLISRIDEILSKYRSLAKEIKDEFYKLFVITEVIDNEIY